MKIKGWLILPGFILMMLVIYYGGKFLSRSYDKNYRETIDKNSTLTVAEVYNKKTHKGNTVHFKYYFKDNLYKNNEQNDSFFKTLTIGDLIIVVLDSTNPEDSCILQGKTEH